MKVNKSSSQPEPGKRPDYGIDAPFVVRNLALLGAVGCLVSILALFVVGPQNRFVASLLFGFSIGPGVSLLFTAAAMLYSSKVGKLQMRENLLSRLPWRGDERVLDVGCGRGLLLTSAARRLTTGKAVGIDLWQQQDLSGNNPEATRANARAEGVEDRIEIVEGDARHLPFPDASFDMVVSCACLHNIYDRQEREQAILEIDRVLKPGGHLAIADFRHIDQYIRILRSRGIETRKVSWKRFIGVKTPEENQSANTPVTSNP